MLILLWGLPADSPLALVHQELKLLGAPVRLLDQRDVLQTQVCLSIGNTVRGQVQVRGETLRLEDVTAVYHRFYNSPSLPHIAEADDDQPRRHAAQVDELITHWIDTTPAFVVNRPEAAAANTSKPYQLRWIEQFGWRIPQTLVTTDPAAAREFWERHGTVIYKSVSSIRSRVSKLAPAHRDRFDTIATCPTQFQEFIPGTDFRVHVVGREVFPTEVLSSADDYRYPGEHPVEYRPASLPSTLRAPGVSRGLSPSEHLAPGRRVEVARGLPPEIEDRCRRMSRAMNLPVAGIDLRRTPDGDWVCFEVNPSPGFTPYENETGQRIGNAIARLLVNPPRYPFLGGGLAHLLGPDRP